MPTLVDKTARPEDRFIAAFEMHEGHTLNGTNAALHGARQQAIKRFAGLGFPPRKAEAWKYTDVDRLTRRAYALQLGPAGATLTADDVSRYLVPGLDAHLLVLVNGRFDKELSRLGDLPEGVLVTGFGHASEAHVDLVNAHFGRYADGENEPFTALNTAFAQDGAFVYVPKSAALEKPVHVLSLVVADEDLMLQPRHLFIAEENAQVKLIFTSQVLTDTPTFENVVTEVFVGSRAHVDLYEIQYEDEHASLVSNMQAYQQDESIFRTSTFTFDGEVIRNNINILPDAEYCESHMYGLVLAGGTTHVDNHTLVDHARPNCFSNELYKSVLDGKATGVFNGRVLVRQDAQQTNAYQSNKTVLMSDDARMYSKPELEIYADDVKCSHGATTGRLDADAIFYLRSRGLTERRSRALLLVAFARDVLENVRIEPLRAHLDALVIDRFQS